MRFQLFAPALQENGASLFRPLDGGAFRDFKICTASVTWVTYVMERAG